MKLRNLFCFLVRTMQLHGLFVGLAYLGDKGNWYEATAETEMTVLSLL